MPRILIFSFVLTLLSLLASFGFALAPLDEAASWVRWVTFVIPIAIVTFSLFTYLMCIMFKNGDVLLLLLLMISLAFVISVSLWFAVPDQDRLEPLSTLLALDAAFLGYMSSTSGRGRLRIALDREGEGDNSTLHVNVEMVIDDAEAPRADGEPSGKPGRDA